MSKMVYDNKIFDSFNNLIDYLEYFFEDDVSFVVTNKDTFIMQKNNSNLPMKATVGDEVPKGGAISEAIKTGKNIIRDVPKEVYGTPFTSYAIPVKGDNGEVEGCIVMAKSIVKKTEVFSQIRMVSSALEQIAIAINNLTSGVQEVVNMNSDILAMTQKASEESKDTDGILKFIQGIAGQTNMLGLNAAIEAARAGENGKGFNVVATEIRKLSASTSESVKKVDSVLKNVGISIKNINEKISKSNDVYQDEAASLEEITASILELNSATYTLEKLAKTI